MAMGMQEIESRKIITGVEKIYRRKRRLIHARGIGEIDRVKRYSQFRNLASILHRPIIGENIS